MAFRRWVRRAVLLVALTVTAPLVAIEVLNRSGIARVGELPQLQPAPRLSPLHRAIWAAEEACPMVVQPQWPWGVLWRSSLTTTSGRAPSMNGASLCTAAADHWLEPRVPLGHGLDWA